MKKQKQQANNVAKKDIVHNKKHKVDAAVVTAAAVAVLWILLEVLLYVTAMPQSPEVDPIKLCTTENENGVFKVEDKALSIKLSEDTDRIEYISFDGMASEADPTAERSSMLTVKIKGYDPAKSNTLITYRTEKFYVGFGENVRTDIKVNIPKDAGEVIIELGYDDFDYTVSNITLNSPDAVSFNFLRTGIVICIILAVFISVKLSLSHKFFDPKKHTAFAAVLVCVCVLISLMFISVMNPEQDAVTYPFEKKVTSYNPYEQQFDAFMKGQLHLDIEPSEGLLELKNPYDPASRDGVAYSWDRAYYNGKYYSYFGMAPIFTVYMPYHFITGTLPAENTVTAIFTVMTALFFSLAAIKWAAMYTKKLPLSLLAVGVIGALVSTQVFLIMRGRAKFYYIATVAGMAFASLFLWLILCAISGTARLASREDAEPKYARPILYALAGLAYGLLFLSRLNMALLVAFAVIPMIWFRIVTEKKAGEKRHPRKLKNMIIELSALGLPVICAFVLQFVMNKMRFDRFFEFGTTYQLTVSDVSLNKLRFTDLPYAIFHYFLHPISPSSDFPIMSLYYISLNNYGHYVYVDTGMGLLAIPFMWALLGSIPTLGRKTDDAGNKAILACLLVGMVFVALMNFCLGGVIFRYMCDLTVLGAFAAMAVMFSLHESAEEACEAGGSIGACRLSSSLIAALSVLSVIVSVSLAFSINGNLTAYDAAAYDAFRDIFTFY